jgi:hypothetical protein
MRFSDQDAAVHANDAAGLTKNQFDDSRILARLPPWVG